MSRKPRAPVEADTLAKPRDTTQLIGHAAAERLLLTAATSGRLPHGWLIAGPQGVGKATLAYRFARFLLSGGANSADSGGLFAAPPPPDDLNIASNHPVFRQVSAQAHPDLQVLERSVNDKTGKLRSEISVEEARAAVDFLHHTASEGGWRVVLVDSIDEMSRSAANALLKALEEPPPRAVLLLVSHAPGGLLPTIRSRCCHLPLTPLSDHQVQQLFSARHPEVSANESRILVSLAEGSIGRAEALLAAGGVDLYSGLMALLASVPGLDSVTAHGFAEAAAKGDGTAFSTVGELLTWWLARLTRAGALGEVPAALVPAEEGLAARLLTRRRLADWVALWEKLTRLFARADRANLDRKQTLLAALLDFEGLVAVGA